MASLPVPSSPVPWLSVRSFAVASLSVRSLAVASWSVRSLAVASLLVRSLPIYSLYTNSLIALHAIDFIVILSAVAARGRDYPEDIDYYYTNIFSVLLFYFRSLSCRVQICDRALCERSHEINLGQVGCGTDIKLSKSDPGGFLLATWASFIQSCVAPGAHRATLDILSRACLGVVLAGAITAKLM